MDLKAIFKDDLKLSRAATLILFLALVRTIGEIIRLQYYSTTDLTFEQIKPFAIASLMIAIMLFIITILSFYHKNKTITALVGLTIVAMLALKWLFHLK